MKEVYVRAYKRSCYARVSSSRTKPRGRTHGQPSFQLRQREGGGGSSYEERMRCRRLKSLHVQRQQMGSQRRHHYEISEFSNSNCELYLARKKVIGIRIRFCPQDRAVTE